MTDDDALFDEMDAAIDGAYSAAPNGEGVAGALYFAARAAVLVARGMKAPEAVAKAIGERGMYGVPRRYAVMPREALPEIVAGWCQVKNRGGSDYEAYAAMVKRAEDPHAEV